MFSARILLIAVLLGTDCPGTRSLATAAAKGAASSPKRSSFLTEVAGALIDTFFPKMKVESRKGHLSPQNAKIEYDMTDPQGRRISMASQGSPPSYANGYSYMNDYFPARTLPKTSESKWSGQQVVNAGGSQFGRHQPLKPESLQSRQPAPAAAAGSLFSKVAPQTMGTEEQFATEEFIRRLKNDQNKVGKAVLPYEHLAKAHSLSAPAPGSAPPADFVVARNSMKNQTLTQAALDSTAIAEEFIKRLLREQENSVLPLAQKSAELKSLAYEASFTCPQCILHAPRKMIGPWTQIYGNKESLKLIYSELKKFQQSTETSQYEWNSDVQPGCVRFEIGKPYADGLNDTVEKAALNIFFRDRLTPGRMYKVTGVMHSVARIGTSIVIPGFRLPMCAIQVGPSSSTLYGYMVLTETAGRNKCRSLHIFGRTTESFLRESRENVARDLLRQGHQLEAALPLEPLPMSSLCEKA